MLKSYLLSVVILSHAALFGQNKTEPFCIAETTTINSEILGEDRVLNIHKPESFETTKPCDVIYLLDGSAGEDFVHIVGLTQFFNMMYVMPNYILVGLANVDRKRDFTFPTTVAKDKEAFPTTGSSENFMAFIEQELQPYINKTYKTSGNSFLIGQSLGGLLASEILIKKPHLFNNYLIVSPSLWWDNKSLLDKAVEQSVNQNIKAPKIIYIAVGADEEKGMINPAKKLYSIYKKKKLKTQKIIFNKLPNEDHATVLHQAISDAFKAIFPPRY